MSKEKCKICGNIANNKTVVAKEMMFGFKDEFVYVECSGCGCLQIMEIPENIIKYYPESYYSFDNVKEDEIIEKSFIGSVIRKVKEKLLDIYLPGDSFIGKVIFRRVNYPWLKKAFFTSGSKILDVGCGSGELLLVLKNQGFKNLTGVDPYISGEINYSCGITIYKKALDDLKGSFDIIMLHHSFEHMDEPLVVLKKIYKLLNPGGCVIMRVPVAACFAWRKYGVNWVQLDAPRHFYLHTTQSIQILSSQAGFNLSDVIYDSFFLQFVGSEKYQRGIPLSANGEIFSKQKIMAFAKESKRLNSINDGDAACFVLSKQ